MKRNGAATMMLARPTRGSIEAAKKVLSYLAATQDFKISGIMSPKVDKLEYYSDSDHAGDMPLDVGRMACTASYAAHVSRLLSP